MNEASADHAKSIIKKIQYLTIATVCADGQPWNSAVYTAYDDNYNFYWASWHDSQHSKNIRRNNEVFIVIYDSTVPADTGWGVYMKAKVSELTEKSEVGKMLPLFYGRRNKPARKPEEFLGDYPRRIYKAVPQKVWMNDSDEINGNYIDTRTEVDLS